ncbi:hypothetical protein SNE40_008295 [Patella caerulea]|uniref:SH2 domain-containing protein n=1 Tax=Patella caerulea TaxID=87958 RepID=A0AAN8JYK6_PATCE
MSNMATAHPRKDLKMPLPPVPGSNPPALPPRRSVPPPPASPSPTPQPVAEEEYYDEFDVEDEHTKTPSDTAAATGDTDEDYDEFDVPEEGPQVYELDGSPPPTPPPVPSQHRRGPLPKPPPQEEVYDVPGEDEEEDASAGSYHSTGVASSGSDDQPPPVPPINNRRPKPNPPSRAAEKKITLPSIPGGVIDIRAISEGRNRLKKVDKPVKAEEPKEKIKPLVVLKPVLTVKPIVKKTETKTQESASIQEELKAKVSNSHTKVQFETKKPTTPEPEEADISEDDDSGEIYDECVSLSDPLATYPWYMNVDRQTSNNRIKTINKDGTFLIRNSGGDKSGNTSHPYTLCVLYENRIRNLKIRQRSDKKFALGEYKDNELTFDSVEKLVEHHKKNDVILIGTHQGKVKLLHVASNG